MSQNHSVTKRNRRNKSGKRGHIGQATQHALRTPKAKALALRQECEIAYNKVQAEMAGVRRKAAKEDKRIAMKEKK